MTDGAGAAPLQSTPVPDAMRQAPPEDLAPALESVCFALNRALTLDEAATVLGRSRADIIDAADTLATRLRATGLMLQRHADELQLVTRPETAWAVQRALHPERPGRLSRASLETLAIVAYRQPVTRSSVEAIRGVNCDAVLDTLERRALIAEVGRQDTAGNPRLFGTTLRFLQMVGLERVEDLPAMPEGSIPAVFDIDEDETVDPAGDDSADGAGAPEPALQTSSGFGTDTTHGAE